MMPATETECFAHQNRSEMHVFVHYAPGFFQKGLWGILIIGKSLGATAELVWNNHSDQVVNP
jgi:hypothetical protein